VLYIWSRGAAAATTAAMRALSPWSSLAKAQAVRATAVGGRARTSGVRPSARHPSSGPGWKPSLAYAHTMAAQHQGSCCQRS